MQTQVNKIPSILRGHTDPRWEDNTVYNFFNTPKEFMNSLLEYANHPECIQTRDGKDYLYQGKQAYERINKKNASYNKVYEDVAKQVRDKLHARGFTGKLLYGDISFTSQKTGCMSKQRALMGKPDCYFQNTSVDDGKLFHDLYINLSYSWSISDETIENNSYALYALCKELSRLISIRVIVVNHTGHTAAKHLCYSYILKQFRQPINPKEFLFFTSDSKRTFGWASYEMLHQNPSATVGTPTNTISIADINLDTIIDNLWDYYKSTKG